MEKSRVGETMALAAVKGLIITLICLIIGVIPLAVFISSGKIQLDYIELIVIALVVLTTCIGQLFGTRKVKNGKLITIIVHGAALSAILLVGSAFSNEGSLFGGMTYKLIATIFITSAAVAVFGNKRKKKKRQSRIK